MINNDRIVPVTNTDLLSLYSAVLAAASVTLTKVNAAAPGEFAISAASTALICAEPVKTVNITTITAATIYFVAAEDFKGFSLAGVYEEPTEDSVDVVPGSGDLYKAVLADGDITITRVGF